MDALLATDAHPFVRRPHRSFLALALPVMASLAVEPLAGIVDTAFVERLGTAPAAALGAATALLASAVWVFNFLGIGTQTEVARALGRGDARASRAAGLATALALVLGVGFAGLAWPWLEAAAAFMSDDAAVRDATERYLRIRLLGMPAALLLLTAFGALRGRQDMRTPVLLALGATVVNVVLDALLIHGTALTPRLGVAGAAWATVASQLLGAGLALVLVDRRVGLAAGFDLAQLRGLLRVGRDLVLRTSALLLFLLLATRAALASGTEAGAAHQALRQVWILLAFLLDAYAAAAQSLVAYFLAGARPDLARRTARLACGWALGTGLALAAGLLLLEPAIAWLLVPPEARAVFASAWLLCALSQPLNALAFATDGVHWGSGDFAFLRNAMLGATGAGLLALAALDPASPRALLEVWGVTALWIALRAAFGVLRIWPGTLRSPLRPP